MMGVKINTETWTVESLHAEGVDWMEGLLPMCY